ncbi:hypothetical protein [Pseudomonas sp. NPDC096950]|uniref:hypothetical protein n=1 Tax=Pseudomonas sp. NPDC096950 TaxID=3364485 RepID=UPI00383B0DA0
MAIEFRSVIFKNVTTGFHEIVPVEQALEFSDASRDTHDVYGALSSSKFPFAYAKPWYFTASGKTSRIGAGAYGDTLVVQAAQV